jgi:hypothetical protein
LKTLLAQLNGDALWDAVKQKDKIQKPKVIDDGKLGKQSKGVKF